MLFPFPSKPQVGGALTLRAWVRRLAALTILFALSAQAEPACYGSVCVEARSGAGYTELVGINHNHFPVTLNLGLRPVNMRADTDAQAHVLPPRATVPLLRLRVEDPAKPASYTIKVGWARGNPAARHDDSYVYGLPYLPGLGFKVTQSANGRFSHHGDARYAIDFDMPEGTPVFAAREGKVVAVEDRHDRGGPHPRFEPLANYVVIEHPDGTYGEYLHLQRRGVKVKVGDRVRRGQLIGLSGNTGFSSGPHLHFMVAGATADGGRRSYPVRFHTSEGPSELQAGRTYLYQLDGAPEGLADVAPAAGDAIDGVGG